MERIKSRRFRWKSGLIDSNCPEYPFICYFCFVRSEVATRKIFVTFRLPAGKNTGNMEKHREVFLKEVSIYPERSKRFQKTLTSFSRNPGAIFSKFRLSKPSIPDFPACKVPLREFSFPGCVLKKKCVVFQTAYFVSF